MYDSACRVCSGNPIYEFPEYWVRGGGATILSSPFTMPAANATGIANVENVENFKPGQVVYVSPLGYLTVTAVAGGPGPGTLTLRNIGYASNKAPGEIAPTGTVIRRVSQ